LLLHLYKEKGIYAARLRCKEKGRTPLYYAIRYEAPEGVVELLLSCMTREDILDGDREGKSALGLIWGNYVNSMNGRKHMNYYKNKLKKWEINNVTLEDRIVLAKEIREEMVGKGGKLLDCWKKANMLLRGAFKFPNDDDDDQQQQDRTWRILHAAVSMRNDSSLAIMAFVLHPEQVREIDSEDLYRPTTSSSSSSSRTTDNNNCTRNQLTALHLAAKSAMSGRDSQTIISHLLEMYPEAASIVNPADNSYPLHYLCENPSKLEWEQDIEPIYNTFPEAMNRQDINGRTPFHRAFTVSSERGAGAVPPAPAPHGTPTVMRYSTDPDVSIVQKILTLNQNVASIPDKYGKLPFHSLAEFGETWDENVQCLYDALPTAISTRTNRLSGNNLPIHLVASNPDARASLVNKILELNPRGATLENHQGKLPLHLACESGKSFDGGFESIYNAYPNAINLPERNDRGWMPLHFSVTCPNSTTEHIEQVLNLNQNAANVVDGSNKTVLHLAIESGKDWDNGLRMLFDANPDAIEVEDGLGRIPLVTALLTYHNGSGNSSGNDVSTTGEQEQEQEQQEDQQRNNDDALLQNDDVEESQELSSEDVATETVTTVTTEETDNMEDLHLSQVNVLYHLLKSAPYVLHRVG